MKITFEDGKASVRLPGGIELSGDKDRVVAALYDLGYEEAARILRAAGSNPAIYHSKSSGPILIDSMNHEHVRRALNVKIREWANSLSAAPLTGTDYLRRLTDGVCSDDPEFLPLIKRYAQAIKDGELDED